MDENHPQQNCSNNSEYNPPLENIKMPVGIEFPPTIENIFRYLLPQRILHGQPVLAPPNHDKVKDTDIYGKDSPPELFIDSDQTEFYCFTFLKPSETYWDRVARACGGGTWFERQRKDCSIDGIEAGVRRSFTFKYSEKNAEDDGGITSWIMHEYSINEGYACNLQDFKFDSSSKFNPENIVFCHIWKKVNKKKLENDRKRRGELHQEEERKKACNKDCAEASSTNDAESKSKSDR